MKSNHHNIIIGLDESNKSSIYGEYIFVSSIFSEDQIKNIIKKGIKIQDSKLCKYKDCELLFNYISKNYSNHFNVIALSPKNYDYIISKYKINLNDLTMICHLMNINNLCSKKINFLNINFKIIIDDFMNNKKNKNEYVQKILKIIVKFKNDNILNIFSTDNINALYNTKIYENINFVSKADKIFKQVSIASQIAYYYHINNINNISHKYNIDINILKKGKNNFDLFFNEISKNKFQTNIINNVVRAKYCVKSLNKLKIILKKNQISSLDLDKKFQSWFKN